MPQITDKEISKTYEKVVEGKGMFVNFYLVGGQKKFSLFVAKGKTIPKVGMRVALMEWDEVQEGEYLNNKIKNIVWMGADTKTATGKAPESGLADKNSPIWFCTSYAKDLQVARIQTGQTDPNKSLEELGLEVALVAVDMLRFIEHPVDLAKEKKVDTEEQPTKRDIVEEAMNDVDDSEIPF